MANAEVVKVTRNYQVTIRASVRRKAGIREGQLVRIWYDEKEGVVKIEPVRVGRIRVRLGRSVSVEEVEEGVTEFLDEATA